MSAHERSKGPLRAGSAPSEPGPADSGCGLSSPTLAPSATADDGEAASAGGAILPGAALGV
ncbi:MAG: hypothetical protein KGQ35_13235, partial [Burkholderiales bacterium]|nr:hypothetical protein [Burkholderiales bacterium]